MGKSSINGSFSMAMLDNQRVKQNVAETWRSWGVTLVFLQIWKPRHHGFQEIVLFRMRASPLGNLQEWRTQIDHIKYT